MTKTVFNTTITYEYNEAHSGAHYTLDGGRTFMNGGEFNEVNLKHCLGYAGHKDANTRYDEGSDIPEIACSVKSSKATLVNMVLGETLEETLTAYFANTASKLFCWTFVENGNTIAYFMNANEFRVFTETFANYDKERKVVRFKAQSGRMLKWFAEVA